MDHEERPLKTLERVLSKAGLGSRVEARRWVHARRVKVNGKVIENPDHWIDLERDQVMFDDSPLEARALVYVLLYKPAGYLTTYKDPEGRPTVYDLLSDVGTFVSTVGRLDFKTSGLLLMTNDNAFAEHLLTHGGVAVVPGSGFGAPGHMRLSFACSMQTLEEALRRMEKTLRAAQAA